jgi:hypothetical protein
MRTSELKFQRHLYFLPTGKSALVLGLLSLGDTRWNTWLFFSFSCSYSGLVGFLIRAGSLLLVYISEYDG